MMAVPASTPPVCKNVHHWGSFRPMPHDDGTGKLTMTRMCPHCGLTMAEYAKTKTPDRKR
jgi:hypothetical protein